jgi:hypothetical protein
MALHLAEISRTVTPGAHAVLLLDQAGWHLSARLDIPANITLMPLPPKSPELNPVENIQFIRDNWLSNRVFGSYDDILDHCCFAWNKGNVTATGRAGVADKMASWHGPSLVSATSLPAADHPACDLALSPVHPELPRRGGAPRRTRARYLL